MKVRGARAPNDKVKRLEDEIKSCQGRLDGFGNELKNLLAEINTISDWIYARFGVNLIDKSSLEQTEFNYLKDKIANTEINSTESLSNKSAKHPPDICSNIKINNAVSILSPDFNENSESDSDNDREANTLKKRRGRPKKASLQPLSPVHITDINTSSQVSISKRCRPKKKQSSDIPKTTVDTRIKCETCGKILKDAGSLRQHLLIHKNIKPYPCPECGKCFGRKFHLKTHRLIHAGVKKFQCGYCGKLFLLPKDLIAHERTHTGEKPFSCTVCPKSFNLKSHLVMHLRTHTGEKPYRCEVCEKCFSQSNSLRVHKKVHQKTRNTTKNSLARPHRRHVKQDSSAAMIYSVPNSVLRSCPNPNNLSNIEEADHDTLSTASQSDLSPSTADIPVADLVTFEIVSIASPATQQKLENRNPIHQNVKIEPNNLTVQDVLQLQPEISNTVEIMNLNHVNIIEQIIRNEDVDNRQNEEQVNENIVQGTSQSYIGNDVNGPYFY